MFSGFQAYNFSANDSCSMHLQVATRNPQQSKPETKNYRYYLGKYEKEINHTTNITTEYYYVGGPMGNIAVYISENGAEPELYYTITDHLSSIVAIADEDGEIIEEQRFDPCSVKLEFCELFFYSETKHKVELIPSSETNREGQYRNSITGETEETPQLTMLFRGYTGHVQRNTVFESEANQKQIVEQIPMTKEIGKMLPEFGLINMFSEDNSFVNLSATKLYVELIPTESGNGRLYDPVIARVLSPDNYVQNPYNPQNYNRYSYCYNNPLKYTDPDGDIIIVDSWIIGFVHGFFSTGSGRLSAGWDEANLRAKNDAKIWGGLFVSDPNKSTGNRIVEVISRFTWQLPQTVGGFMTAHSINTLGLYGGVSQVDYAYGATAVTTRSDSWGAVAQGSYIIGNNTLRADANNPLFQHEYGHYLQSQEMGWAYYPRVGIPSARSKGVHDFHAVEQDANRRAFLYFNKNIEGFQDDAELWDNRGWNFWSNPLNINGTNTRGQYVDYRDPNQVNSLDVLRVRAKWYDHASWLFLPVGGPIWVGLINSGIYNR